ncbi:hypothetical protein FA15DRAFT_595776, partial [Coprinopsis marcescibilis]
TTHTYLDGIGPFMYLGLWAVDTLHSTATLSIQSVATACVGYSLMHCLNIFLSCSGHSGWTGFFLARLSF